MAIVSCIAGITCALHGADVKTFDVPSAAMGMAVKVSVVTPAAYGTDSKARFPVVYLLHGAGNDHSTYVQPFLLDGVDKWRFIAVVPDGKLDWWLDSPVSPNVRRETFVVNELVPWVDAEFRTLPQRQRRAVAGHSMGGQGAMRLGMRHSDVFGIVGNVIQHVQWRSQFCNAFEHILSFPFSVFTISRRIACISSSFSPRQFLPVAGQASKNLQYIGREHLRHFSPVL